MEAAVNDPQTQLTVGRTVLHHLRVQSHLLFIHKHLKPKCEVVGDGELAWQWARSDSRVRPALPFWPNYPPAPPPTHTHSVPGSDSHVSLPVEGQPVTHCAVNFRLFRGGRLSSTRLAWTPTADAAVTRLDGGPTSRPLRIDIIQLFSNSGSRPKSESWSCFEGVAVSRAVSQNGF